MKHVWFAVFVVGCASAPQPLPEPPASPPPPSAEPRVSSNAQSIIRLCEILRDEEGMTFAGNDVQQARARQEHQRRRLESADAGYVVDVPASGFAFRRYDLAERRLEIDGARSFVIGDGVEVQPLEGDTPLAFELPPDAAESLLQDHERGRITLRVVFRPTTSELRKGGCIRLSGGHVVKLPARPLAYSVLGADGQRRAHAQTSEFGGEAVGATDVRTPEVTVGRARTLDGRDLPEGAAAAVRPLGAALLPCYQKALEKRPRLRGTLVIEARVTGDGRVEAPRMEMSTLQDEPLVACVVARVTKVRLSGIPAQRLSVSFSFGAKEDR